MLENQVTSVKRARDKVTVTIQSVKNANTLHEGETLGPEIDMEFDEIVFACDADTALTILGTQATMMEKKVLGNVKASTPFHSRGRASPRTVSLRHLCHTLRQGIHGKGQQFYHESPHC